jgi:hypothetical protein
MGEGEWKNKPQYSARRYPSPRVLAIAYNGKKYC